MSLPPSKKPNQFPFSSNEMAVIAKYFNNKQDYIKFMKICKQTRELTELFRYNPIPFAGRTVDRDPESVRRLFPNVETFHVEPFCSIRCIQHYVTHGKVKRIKFIGETSIERRRDVRQSIDLAIDEYNRDHEKQIENDITYQGKYFCDLTNDVLDEIAIHDADNRIIRLDNIHLVDTVQRLDLEHVEVTSLSGLSRLFMLEEVRLPSTLRNLESRCFSGCIRLSSINFPSKLRSIGTGCFWGCIALTEITIPPELCCIETSVFSQCTNLSRVNIPNPESKYYFDFEFSCFNGCSNLREIVIPPATVTINQWAFANCVNLSSVTIYNGLVNFIASCFSNCISLSSIEIPSSVSCIGYRCFDGCTNLEEVRFLDIDNPNAKLVLERECFRNCQSLRRISEPPPIYGIEPGVFADCPLLTDEAMMVVVNAVVQIHEDLDDEHSEGEQEHSEEEEEEEENEEEDNSPEWMSKE